MNKKVKNSPRNRVLLTGKVMNEMLERMEQGFAFVIFDSIGEQPPFTVRLSVSYFNKFDILYSEPDKETGRFWCGYLIYYNDKFDHERFYEFVKYAARVWSPRDIVYGRNKMLSWEDGYGFRQQWPVLKCGDELFSLTGEKAEAVLSKTRVFVNEPAEAPSEFVFDSYNEKRYFRNREDGKK